eukprot:scaffold194067_cov43-Prasinocladus_malaysianus.AAC.1
METDELDDLDMSSVERAGSVHPLLAPLPYHRPTRSVLEVPPDCEGLMVTSAARGESVYCGLRAPEPFTHQRQRDLMMAFQNEASSGSGGTLSSQPFAKLLAEVENERIDRALKHTLLKYMLRRFDYMDVWKASDHNLHILMYNIFAIYIYTDNAPCYICTIYNAIHQDFQGCV